MGPQGIFKSRVLREIPLSVTTVAVVDGETRPYDDAFGDNGLLPYRYRGTDPRHHENVGLRLAMQDAGMLVGLSRVRRWRRATARLEAEASGAHTALMTAQSGMSLSEVQRDFGAHVANAEAAGDCGLLLARSQPRRGLRPAGWQGL